jgi:hypothetical protein
MSTDTLMYRHLHRFSWQCFFCIGWPSKCGILLPIYRTRGVTCMPRLGITICRVLYFIVKCVFYFKKTVFLDKKRKSTALLTIASAGERADPHRNPWRLAYRWADKISSPTVLSEELWSYDSFHRNVVCTRNNWGKIR